MIMGARYDGYTSHLGTLYERVLLL